MHPYRESFQPEPRESPPPREEWILYRVLTLVGAIPVVLVLASGAPFGVQATVGLMMVAVGLVGMCCFGYRPARSAVCTAGDAGPELARPLLSVDTRAAEDDGALIEDKATILVVDDEVPIRKFLRTTLTSQGFLVRESGTVAEAERMIGEAAPAAILLDLGLPDGDGLALLRRVREWSAVPIIIVSARDREQDKVDALDAGADDYVTKPFAPNELAARVRSAIRISSRRELAATSPILEIGDIRIDRTRHVVTRDGEPVHLTPIEFRLLVLLACNAGKVITHKQLTAEVLGVTRASDSHHLRVHVAALRRKLEADPARPRWLQTEVGVGYRVSGGEPPRRP